MNQALYMDPVTPIYPDMKGECDSASYHTAVRTLRSAGFTGVVPAPPTGYPAGDLVMVHPMLALPILFDIERSSNFKRGVYYSSQWDAVSVPVSKTAFLARENSVWFCLSWDLTHYITIPGPHVLRDSTVKYYSTRIEPDLIRPFYLYPLELARIGVVPPLNLSHI